MGINYFKTALRYLKRNKLLSFINIMGLAVGLACTSLILLWILHERSYDRFHEDEQRLYRMSVRWIVRFESGANRGRSTQSRPANQLAGKIR